ncbi:hypothetical protein ACRE_064400 [Hapsidospora chrysogenum ATCC 11550]|uniref:Uncharacterized protein n=1 Tax=Hapsidospora chrysogenum (strain ATCC 11550 / CBS 779.69 / DSM 880 / IAM 14645 / JCM 23072 / IMI 49137) TaxID=857340 RepID=A0A086T0D3_HAPC1|nr:hypothetical protein ACRE_064400 [Hapsidospora chrysogenum ATCC 11550]
MPLPSSPELLPSALPNLDQDTNACHDNDDENDPCPTPASRPDKNNSEEGMEEDTASIDGLARLADIMNALDHHESEEIEDLALEDFNLDHDVPSETEGHGLLAILTKPKDRLKQEAHNRLHAMVRATIPSLGRPSFTWQADYAGSNNQRHPLMIEDSEPDTNPSDHNLPNSGTAGNIEEETLALE